MNSIKDIKSWGAVFVNFPLIVRVERRQTKHGLGEQRKACHVNCLLLVKINLVDYFADVLQVVSQFLNGFSQWLK